YKGLKTKQKRDGVDATWSATSWRLANASMPHGMSDLSKLASTRLQVRGARAAGLAGGTRYNDWLIKRSIQKGYVAAVEWRK
ncbi:hypothetical protein Tco_1342012, partial [Tanacetum coccineum]